MKMNIGIPEKHIEQSVSILTKMLANEFMLYVKTRKFHWNISGDSFMELHVLFQSQYAEIEVTIDLLAERIAKLGAFAIGTLKEFSQYAQIEEAPDYYPQRKDMLKELLSDHEWIITQFRKDIEELSSKHKDAGTIDFLTGLMEQHETTAWVLRRYLN